MKTGIDPSINRFLAGLDTMAAGFRIMIGATGAEELGRLQQRTAAAFEETAKFEAAVAFVIYVQTTQNGTFTDDQKSGYEQALKTITDRLPVTNQG